MFELIHFPEIDSTNEEAKRRLNEGIVKVPTVILADSQTAGRGSRGRRWVSPPGAGLYFSIVHPLPGTESLRTEAHPTGHWGSWPILQAFQSAAWSLCTRTAGLACAEILNEETGLPVQLKPINDLYVNGQKLGGILCESIFRDEKDDEPVCRGIITGIGINFRNNREVEAYCQTETRRDDDPKNQASPNRPISLERCLPLPFVQQWMGERAEFIRKDLCMRIAKRIDDYYRLLLREGGEAQILQKAQLIQFHP